MHDSVSDTHWDQAYEQGDTTRSWYQPQARESLALIDTTGLARDGSVVDIGGGASALVDGLLARGHRDVTVVDVSAAGMDIARARLGADGDGVTWVVTDLLDWRPARTFDLWHDRAVLHFLTADGDRRAYAQLAARTVAPGGWIVIGGFAPDGPTSCSGLPVRGASGDELAALLGPAFTPVSERTAVHVTPGGNEQRFAWLVAQRR